MNVATWGTISYKGAQEAEIPKERKKKNLNVRFAITQPLNVSFSLQ